MAIHSTANGNHVYAYPPQPGDTHVQVDWFGPSRGDGRLVAFHGPVRPIAEYEDLLAWALKMAPQMVNPLHVLPMTRQQAIERSESLERWQAELEDRLKEGPGS